MFETWQDVAAGLLALAALGWLIRRRRRARAAACDGCASGGCATPPEAAPAAELVTISRPAVPPGPG